MCVCMRCMIKCQDQYLIFLLYSNIQMNLQINFFHPAAICNVITLYTSVKRTSQNHPQLTQFSQSDYNILYYIVEKVLEQGITPGPTTFHDYRNELIRILNDFDLIKRVESILDTIDSLNSFYRLVHKTIEDLKQYKVEGSDQCSIIDVFLRRLAIYFQRLGFKDLIKIYDMFTEFRGQGLSSQMLNEFFVGNQLEEIKFNIENYSKSIDAQQVENHIDNLAKVDQKSRKNGLLKGLNQIVTKKDHKGLDNIFRFFDLEFGTLAADRIDGGPGNSINQTVLTLTFANLKLGFLDQAIRGINEGLRLSQNNSDQECINHCIIYLYQINSLIGKIQEEARLTEHAITHSVNINNVALVVTSCLNYSRLQKNYDCNNEDNNILRSRNIQWTHALHFARKKLYSNYENTCKQPYHFEKNLIIPLLLHKMAIINHVPELKDMLLQGIYSSPEVKALDNYKLLVKDSSMRVSIHNARVCYYRRQLYTYNTIVNLIEKDINESSLEDFIEFWNLKNEILIDKKLPQETLESIFTLLDFCKRKNFKRHHYIKSLLQLMRVHKLQGKYYEALNVLEEIKLCCKGGGKEDILEMNIEAIDLLIKLNRMSLAIQTLKTTEEEELIGENLGLSSKFYIHKAEIFYSLIQMLGDTDEAKEIRAQAEWCEEKGLVECLGELNLLRFRDLLVRRSRGGSGKYLEILRYVEKVLEYFENLRVDYNVEQNSPTKLGEEIAAKIKKMLLA